MRFFLFTLIGVFFLRLVFAVPSVSAQATNSCYRVITEVYEDGTTKQKSRQKGEFPECLEVLNPQLASEETKESTLELLSNTGVNSFSCRKYKGGATAFIGELDNRPNKCFVCQKDGWAFYSENLCQAERESIEFSDTVVLNKPLQYTSQLDSNLIDLQKLGCGPTTTYMLECTFNTCNYSLEEYYSTAYEGYMASDGSGTSSTRNSQILANQGFAVSPYFSRVDLTAEEKKEITPEVLFQETANEIANGNYVMVSGAFRFGKPIPHHAVIVGVDIENQLLIVQDPYFGQNDDSGNQGLIVMKFGNEAYEYGTIYATDLVSVTPPDTSS